MGLRNRVLLVLGGLFAISLFAKSDIFAREVVILLYHFDEGKGKVVKDSSGNNNNGRIINGATWVEGKTGTGIYLKGKESDNYIEVPDSETLRFTGKFSIEFWWKKEGRKDTVIFFRKGKKSRVYNYYAYRESKKIWFSVCDKSGTKEGRHGIAINSPLENGWHHFKFEYDGKYLKIFIDKELAGSEETGKITLYTSDSPLYIGTFRPGYKYSLKGALDEFCIQDDVVTKEDKWVKKSADILPIYEEKLTEDIPLPDALSTWKGKAAECTSELKGVSYRKQKLEGWPLERRLNLLKSIGVTELFHFVRNVKNYLRYGPHPREVSLPSSLDEILTEASKRGMNVWIFLNWNAKGLDFTSKAYVETHHKLIDALAEKKKQFPNLMGTWWDEIWCGMAMNDYKDNLVSFKDFCKREYKEEYPFNLMPPSPNPKDRWWRRYVVYKYCIYENFAQDFHNYSHKKGLKTIPFIVNTHRYRRGWKWGHDHYRQTKIGDYTTSACYYKNPLPVENSIMHLQADFGGFAFTQVFRGLPVEHWAFGRMMDNPILVAKCKEVCSLIEEWKEAKPAEEIAVLSYPVSLMGKFLNAEKVYMDNDELIQQTLTSSFATRMIDIRDTRFYQRYKVLITPKYAGYSIPEFAFQELLAYVKNGGYLIVLDTEFAIGRRDLTNPREKTSAITGLRLKQQEPLSGKINFPSLSGLSLALTSGSQAFSVEKVSNKVKEIAFCNGRPVGFEYSLGKGKVISLYLDFAQQLKEKPAQYGYLLSKLISSYHKPAITAEGNISIQGIIKKDDRVLISLYTGQGPSIAISTLPNEVPFASAITGEAKGKIFVDLSALGIKGKGLQAFSLSNYKAQPFSSKGVPVEISKNLGFENLVIEKTGTKHKSTLLADIERTRKEERDVLLYAKKNPPINYQPFSQRIKVSSGLSRSKASWHSPERENRILIRITNSDSTPHRKEPIIISGKKLFSAIGKRAINENSFSLYQLINNNWQEIPSQVNDWQDKDKGIIKDKDSLFDDNDELVFVTDLFPGKNSFLLYFTNKNIPRQKHSGIKISKEKNSYVLSTGINKITLEPKGGFTIYSQEGKEYLLHLRMGFGWWRCRLWGSGKPWHFLTEGPVETIVKREVKGRIKGQGGTVQLSALYRFYHNSPYIYLLMKSDMKCKAYNIFWPGGNLFPPDKWETRGKSCRILTEDGWKAPGFANVKLRDDYKTVVTFGKPTEENSYGLLVASSTFPTLPRWLIESAGLFWLQPARRHGCYERIENPAVEYIYIQGIKSIEEIDSLAKRLKASLSIKVSPIESR